MLEASVGHIYAVNSIECKHVPPCLPWNGSMGSIPDAVWQSALGAAEARVAANAQKGVKRAAAAGTPSNSEQRLADAETGARHPGVIATPADRMTQSASSQLKQARLAYTVREKMEGKKAAGTGDPNWQTRYGGAEQELLRRGLLGTPGFEVPSK